MYAKMNNAGYDIERSNESTLIFRAEEVTCEFNHYNENNKTAEHRSCTNQPNAHEPLDSSDSTTSSLSTVDIIFPDTNDAKDGKEISEKEKDERKRNMNSIRNRSKLKQTTIEGTKHEKVVDTICDRDYDESFVNSTSNHKREMFAQGRSRRFCVDKDNVKGSIPLHYTTTRSSSSSCQSLDSSRGDRLPDLLFEMSNCSVPDPSTRMNQVFRRAYYACLRA